MVSLARGIARHAARATSDLDDIGPRTPQLEHVTAILWLLQALIVQSEDIRLEMSVGALAINSALEA